MVGQSNSKARSNREESFQVQAGRVSILKLKLTSTLTRQSGQPAPLVVVAVVNGLASFSDRGGIVATIA